MARVLYFFHPVAHWVGYQARLERELACDQMAMTATGRAPPEYAATLAQVVGLLSCPSVFRASAAVGLDGNEPLGVDVCKPWRASQRGTGGGAP
jgi:beta-lactamase regulating signal transducer with metallopeptidase domain